jgi:hypothetical protein
MINKFYEFFRSKVNDNDIKSKKNLNQNQENDINNINNLCTQFSQEIKAPNKFNEIKEINTISFSQNSKKIYIKTIQNKIININIYYLYLYKKKYYLFI